MYDTCRWRAVKLRERGMTLRKVAAQVERRRETQEATGRDPTAGATWCESSDTRLAD